MSLNLNSLSDSDIAFRCRNPDIIISGDPDVRCLAKLSDNVIVKCGWSVTPEEAANQEFAYKYSYACDLKVPKIYRYFRMRNIGYIVMEFIEGTSLEKVQFHKHSGLVQRLATAIHNLFQQMPVDSPGPRNGGIPRGSMFSEDGAGTTLNTMAKLNQWLNERFLLEKDELGFNFDLSDCRFCHLDLTRRNIILCPDGSFCLLDWEHAGFYPTVFETYCLLFARQHDYEFSQELLEALDNLSPKTESHEELERHVQMLDRVYRNNLRYCFSNADDTELRKEAEKFAAFPFPLHTEVSTSTVPPPALFTETVPPPLHLGS
ncbi:hypothetical protein DTO166G4_8199 [Paecilomyces variotii]|nr:hypothetical protein DTO166G4_8199 [Paecilomyces variotii]KAJ9242397.1 hypothetical protein DTO166G5_800 [Paecilomyces variotii]KAJ9350503.1 hypothetical protein DTO027B9_6895 [Paecilomyces variotii]